MKRALFVFLLTLSTSPVARGDDAQPALKLDFAKAEEVKTVVWKAAAQAGLNGTYGNTRTVNFSAGANVSRNDGKNRLTIDLGGAYGVNMTPDGVGQGGKPIDTEAQLFAKQTETVANFLGKVRYDRFFTANNSLYLAGFGGFDLPAGKKLYAGAQFGYARQLYKTKAHDAVVEGGADYNMFCFRAANEGTAEAPFCADPLVHVGAARIFLGYGYTFNENTNFAISAETFINVNSVKIGGKQYGFAQASRLLGKASLTTKLSDKVSFRFSVAGRYENARPLRPNPAGFTIAETAPEDVRLVYPYDLTMDAALVISIL